MLFSVKLYVSNIRLNALDMLIEVVTFVVAVAVVKLTAGAEEATTIYGIVELVTLQENWLVELLHVKRLYVLVQVTSPAPVNVPTWKFPLVVAFVKVAPVLLASVVNIPVPTWRLPVLVALPKVNPVIVELPMRAWLLDVMPAMVKLPLRASVPVEESWSSVVLLTSKFRKSPP